MKNEPVLPRKTVLMMAFTAGVIVANLNFIQPIEALIANDFQISKAVVGILAMLTQLGYAFGLLLIVPLGDIFDRYHLIQFMMVLSIIALLLAFMSPTMGIFAVATTLIGITSVAPQIIIPYAGFLAPALQRGKVLGTGAQWLADGNFTFPVVQRAFGQRAPMATDLLDCCGAGYHFAWRRTQIPAAGSPWAP